MNKTILIGVGVVAAFLLYRKFMATPKVEEVEEVEEQAEGEGGGAPSGGGGGGGSAPAPKPTDKPTTKKSMVQSKPITGLRPKERRRPRPNERRGGVRGTSTPMSLKMARPLPASKPMQKLAGFMDFDGFPDVQSEIM